MLSPRRTLILRRLAAAALAPSLVLGALLACKQPAPSSSKELEKARSALNALATRLPAAGAAARPCDDAALAKRGNAGERLWIDGFDLDALRAPPGKASHDWIWLNSILAREFLGVDPDGRSPSDWDALQLDRFGLVAVISSTERRLPKVEGKTYSAGRFRGALQIVDLAKGEVLCEAPVAFETADEVSYRARGIFGTNAEKAVLSDFQDRGRQAGTAALRSISKVAYVSSGAGSWGE